MTPRPSTREMTEILRAMKRHPLGPVALAHEHGDLRLVGRHLLAEIAAGVLADALGRLTEPEPGWDDAACLGTEAAFDSWVRSHDLRRFLIDPDPDGYEHLLAMRLELDLAESSERAADELELRARGWTVSADGKWNRGRPEPRSIAGEIEA
jgi:hypothetical protein